MDNCIFCNIINGSIPSKILHNSDDIVVIEDIDKKAPVHFLVIPKLHVARLSDLTEFSIISRVYHVISTLTKEMNIDYYRVVVNCGESAGQTVNHIHFHVLSGRDLSWPPG